MLLQPIVFLTRLRPVTGFYMYPEHTPRWLGSRPQLRFVLLRRHDRAIAAFVENVAAGQSRAEALGKEVMGLRRVGNQPYWDRAPRENRLQCYIPTLDLLYL
jgi:hypothetical protein